jgi:hypothetical protein
VNEATLERLAALVTELKPLAAYGVVGTSDVEQAKLQSAIAEIERELAALARRPADGGVTDAQIDAAIEAERKYASHFRFEGDGQFGGYIEARSDEPNARPHFDRNAVKKIARALLPPSAPQPAPTGYDGVTTHPEFGGAQPVPQAEGMEADAWLKEAKRLVREQNKALLDDERGAVIDDGVTYALADDALWDHLGKRISPSIAIQQADQLTGNNNG